MCSLRLMILCFLCFTLFFIPIVPRQAIAQPDFQFYDCVETQGNFTTNTTYKANLDHLLSTFTTDHQIDYGFYNFSYGHENRANVIGLCRGDLAPNACTTCLNNSRTLLPLRCPNQTEAIGWYDECMLRYSNRSIFNSIEISPAFRGWNPNNASDPNRFIQIATTLLQQLTHEAALGDSRLKFSTGITSIPNFPTIYGAVQCTPDLSPQNCTACLLGAIQRIQLCCGGKAGGRIGRPSCNFRFESYLFYQQSPVSSTPSPNPTLPPSPLLSNSNTPPPQRKTSRTVIFIVVPIIVGVVSAVMITITIRIFLTKTKRRNSTTHVPASMAPEDEETDLETSQFDFDTIKIATNGFSEENKLGEGGFGAVYKGQLPSGETIAVKRLSQTSNQGENEFKTEILLVAKLQHRNLVRLLGFCFKENEKLLIYEFVENSSLEKFLFNPYRRVSLDWKTRYNIIGGITRGLVYLHEDSQLRIIHRDLKASNILLDNEMNAKISDFGTARLFSHDQIQGDTRKIVGTYGYMAPEYVHKGHFSIKSDVFSFGVLVLEIVTGLKSNHVHPNNEIVGVVGYAWKNWQSGDILNLIDPTLTSGSKTEMVRCIHIGLLCVQENVVKRPTMGTILLMLNSCSITLPRPSQPAFILSSTNSQVSEQSNHNSTQELNDMSITDLYPR
ncbi:putative receptor-like protein kinase At4g00960 [Benincasa hispida]|uniref:putative receptor-like protein kinase At4g00960 n=1 Tax=Benincasa hispida TaxID=102211 RepID=UPI001900BEE7|nr:putative receptor-like protein kinase At4g00960 [Benincasa hispida]